MRNYSNYNLHTSICKLTTTGGLSDALSRINTFRISLLTNQKHGWAIDGDQSHLSHGEVTEIVTYYVIYQNSRVQRD